MIISVFYRFSWIDSTTFYLLSSSIKWQMPRNHVPVQALNVSRGRWSAAAQVPRFVWLWGKGLRLPSSAQNEMRKPEEICQTNSLLTTSAVCLPLVFSCIWITQYCSHTAMFSSKWWNKSGKCICFNLLFSSQLIKCLHQYWKFWWILILPAKYCEWTFLWYS